MKDTYRNPCWNQINRRGSLNRLGMEVLNIFPATNTVCL